MDGWSSYTLGGVFTSESVCEGHPDKLADQISDGVLDAILLKDPFARVACETAVKAGFVLVMGEIASDCYIDIPTVIRRTVRDVGYTDGAFGFEADTCGILIAIDEQSPDIARGVDVGGAGDSGIVFGFACDDTPELMPLPIVLAHRLARRLAAVRKDGSVPYLGPDGKVQVTVDSRAGSARVATVVLSAQHRAEVQVEQLRGDLLETVVDPLVPEEARSPEFKLLINPTGRFILGGPQADTGLTGRKVMVDTYGSYARHGGGCFSGKDPTKVDRSGAYGARCVAKNVVAAALASRCEVQVAYAIGVTDPVAVKVDCFGTEQVPAASIERAVRRVFDLSPLGIIKQLDLRRPLYRPTAAYGHFGRDDIEAPWEDVRWAAELAEAAGL